MQISEESFEVALVLGCCIMLSTLEFGITDVGLAMFAPVFWLETDEY